MHIGHKSTCTCMNALNIQFTRARLCSNKSICHSNSSQQALDNLCSNIYTASSFFLTVGFCKSSQTRTQPVRNTSQSWYFNKIIAKCNYFPEIVRMQWFLLSEHMVGDHQWSLHSCHCLCQTDHLKKSLFRLTSRSPLLGFSSCSSASFSSSAAIQDSFKVARPPASSLSIGNQKNHTPEITSICMIIWHPHLEFCVFGSVQQLENVRLVGDLIYMIQSR